MVHNRSRSCFGGLKTPKGWEPLVYTDYPDFQTKMHPSQLNLEVCGALVGENMCSTTELQLLLSTVIPSFATKDG